MSRSPNQHPTVEERLESARGRLDELQRTIAPYVRARQPAPKTAPPRWTNGGDLSRSVPLYQNDRERLDPRRDLWHVRNTL